MPLDDAAIHIKQPFAPNTLCGLTEANSITMDVFEASGPQKEYCKECIELASK